MSYRPKTLEAICLLFFLSASCIDVDIIGSGSGSPQGEEVRIPVSLSCELLDTESDGPVSRSSHDLSSLRRITDANCYVFSNGALVSQEYFSDAEEFSVILPSGTEKCNLYILANMGEIPVDGNMAEADMAGAVHFDYGNRTNYFSTIEKKGFPMAGIFREFTPSSAAALKLKRLVHTLYVNVDTGELNTTDMKFTGLSIRNAARDVYPFAAESKAEYVMDGDSAGLDADDLDALNRGETVTLYLLENMRGTLFPGNQDWKKKVPDQMSRQDERKYASYIELTAEAQTATALYGCNTYRAYIGETAADCNVRRHSYFTLNNRFTSDMIEDDGWRIEGDDPVVNQTLAFVDTRYTRDTAPDKSATGDVSTRPFEEVDAFYTMPGFIALYYIYRSNPDIEYTLTMERGNSSSSDFEQYVQYEMREVDENFTALFVRTTYPMQGDDERYSSDPSFYGGKCVNFKVESSDGLITDRLTCKILNAPFSLDFRYEGVPESSTGIDSNHGGRFNMYFTNPMKLYVGVHIEGKVYGECVHHPNGLVGAEKTEEYTVQVRTGNRHRDGQDVVSPEINSSSSQIFDVVPVTGRPVRIDRYRPELEFGVGTFYREIDGFHEYFMSVWNNTAWDDNTWFGTSGYDKHAEPTSIEMDISVLYLSPNQNRLLPCRDIPVYMERAVPGIDMGFLFHHSNSKNFTKTIRFATDDAISVSVNGVKDWRRNKVTVRRRHDYGSDYDYLTESMISHRLHN